MYNKYTIYSKYNQHITVCWLADGQHKCHMKKCLEYKNNLVGHMTFSKWPTCWPGP